MPGSTRDQRIAEARFGAIAYRRHIAETHRQATARADDRLRQRDGRGAGRFCLDHDALGRGLEVPAADQCGRALRGDQHIVEAELRRRQFGRVDLDHALAHFPAEDLGLGHARNREDLRLDRPLHQVA